MKPLTQAQVDKAYTVSQESNIPLSEVLQAMINGAQFMTKAEVHAQLDKMAAGVDYRYAAEDVKMAHRMHDVFERARRYQPTIKQPWYIKPVRWAESVMSRLVRVLLR